MDPPPPPNPHLHRATTEREVNLFCFLVMLNFEVMAAAEAAAVHSVSVCNIPKNRHLKVISPSSHLLAQPSSRNGLMNAPCCPVFTLTCGL